MTRRAPARRLLMALALAVVAGTAGCGGDDGDGPPKVAATVAGTDIPSERVERLTNQWVESASSQAIAAGGTRVVRKDAAKLVLGFAIRSEYLQHLADEMGIKDNPSPLDTVAAAEVPASEYQAMGWSQTDLEQSLRDARISKAIGEKVFAKVAVSEVELRQKYDRSTDFFNRSWQSQVRMAFFDGEAPGKALQERALSGDAFEAAARDLGARETGSLGAVNPTTPLPPTVLAVIDGLQAGQTSVPIPGGGGFMVLVADSREDGGGLSFEAVRADLTKVLEDEQRQKLFFDWFKKQLRDAKVEIAGYYGTWDPASGLVS